MIGDPSGRNSTRPALTREQIEANAQTYFAQAGMVLDRDKTEIRYNSEWSDPLARGMIQLASAVHRGAHARARRLHQALQGRHADPVHELLYPLMRGYDSVALKADLELGAPTRSSTCWSAVRCSRNMARSRSAS